MFEDTGEPTSAAPQTDGARDEDGEGTERATVTRSVELDADVDAVWRAVTDPDERRLWLDDPDAAARLVRIDESRPAERLVWTWWHPGDEVDASTVTVDLQPVVGGGTHVVVTEAVPAAPPVQGPVARAAAGPPSGTLRLAAPVPLSGGAGVPTAAPARPARRAPAWLRCTRDRWDARLLGLELLFVTAAARVG
jgi:uncharacterized protein YndB with AHSA1/START domain